METTSTNGVNVGRGNRGNRGNRGGKNRNAAATKVDTQGFEKDTLAYSIRFSGHHAGSFAGTGGVVRLGEVQHGVVSRSGGDSVSYRVYGALINKRPDEAVIGVHPMSNKVAIRLDNEPIRSRPLLEQAKAMCAYVRHTLAHVTDCPQVLKDVSEMQLPVIRAVYTRDAVAEPLDSPALRNMVAQARRSGPTAFVPWNIEPESSGVVVELVDIGVRDDVKDTQWVSLKYVPGTGEEYSPSDWSSLPEAERPETVQYILPYAAGTTPNLGEMVTAGQPLTDLRKVDMRSATRVVWHAFVSDMPWGIDVPRAGAHLAGSQFAAHEAWELAGIPLSFAAPWVRGDVPGPEALLIVEDVRHMLGETAANPAADVLSKGFGPEMLDPDRRFITLTVGVDTPVARIAVENMRKRLGHLACYATDDDLRAGLINPAYPLTLSGASKTYVSAFSGADCLRGKGFGVAVDFGTRDRRFAKQGPLVETGVAPRSTADAMSAAAERLRQGDLVSDVLGGDATISVDEAVLALGGLAAHHG
jgi:hypothetical protein